MRSIRFDIAHAQAFNVYAGTTTMMLANHPTPKYQVGEILMVDDGASIGETLRKCPAIATSLYSKLHPQGHLLHQMDGRDENYIRITNIRHARLSELSGNDATRLGINTTYIGKRKVYYIPNLSNNTITLYPTPCSAIMALAYTLFTPNVVVNNPIFTIYEFEKIGYEEIIQI